MNKRTIFRLSQLCLLLAVLHVPQVQAGMFDDEEARRQVKDLSIQTDMRFDTQQKALFDQANQIQTLREENAKLRGQVETLLYELDSSKKRQLDFYNDLDARLRKFESGEVAAGQEHATSGQGGKAADPVTLANEFEAALNLFKANKVKDAALAFENFVKAHPTSPQAPSAQYWLGNAHYTLRDCKKAIEAHQVVVDKWPQDAKAPDSLLGIADCRQDLGDAKGARATLEKLLLSYPDSSAASTAKGRLKK